MARRSYNQACTMARTLDVVGERWTLLIVRELLLGPRRFTDIEAGVPGIGKNLLSARLRHLEAEGLVRRAVLPPPAASRVYELTDAGRALGPAMAALGQWGIEHLGAPPPRSVFRPAWAVFPLSYMADGAAAAGVHETYELRIGDEVFHLRVDDGRVEPRGGPAERPDAVFALAADTLWDLFFGDLSPGDAIAAGRVQAEGDPETLARALSILAPA